MGPRATAVIAGALSKQQLMRQFCDTLQRGLPGSGRVSPAQPGGASVGTTSCF